MTYRTYEDSPTEGRPVRFYSFIMGTRGWFYTSADRPLSVTLPFPWFGTVHSPGTISDDGVTQSGDTASDSIEIKVPKDHPVAKLFHQYSPSNTIVVQIRQKHIQDAQAIVEFTGFVTDVRNTGDGIATILCAPLSSKFDSGGLRLCYERNCPHMLYDSECRVSANTFKVSGTITAIDGLTIEIDNVSTVDGGWFNGGYLAWDLPDELGDPTGTFERRGITDASGTNGVVLLGTSAGLTVGQAVDLYPGCARDVDTCNDKFNNLANYGGFRHIPGRSPFDGNAVW